MKKTYNIWIDGKLTNEYIRGCIRGMIYALTGMPDIGYPWKTARGGIHWEYRFDATEEEAAAALECVKKAYPEAVMIVKVIE